MSLGSADWTATGDDCHFHNHKEGLKTQNMHKGDFKHGLPP
jgi:hypothetical protein